MADQVLVVGATGGVGQLTVAKLLTQNWTVRTLTRSAEKARKLFDDRVQIAVGDIRQPETLPAALSDITHIISCTGTTAFPSPPNGIFDLPDLNPLQQLQTWGRILLDADYRNSKARNGPVQVDAEGVVNLVTAAPKDLKRLVFVSSCGIERKDKPPYSFLNGFGVLDAKQRGEEAIVRSGLPYTIIRPGRLIDGPYTSSDLNTLLKAKTDGSQGIVLGTGDTLTGQTSRIDVAAAAVESLSYPASENKIFEIVNEGTRPATIDWATLFAQLA